MPYDQPIVQWKFLHILWSTLPLLIVLVLVGTLSGMILNSFEDEILQYPSILILIPAIIGVGGNIGGIFGSRLSTAVHLGILQYDLSNKAFRNNVLAIIIASLTIFSILGIGSFTIATLFNIFTFSLFVMLSIVLSTGGLLTSVIVPLTLITVFLGHKTGWDPDDMVIPIVTTLGDIIGIITLFIVVVVIL